MLVNITHPLIPHLRVLVIPAISLVPLMDGFVVYRIKDNQVYQQHVTIVTRYKEWAVISKGLKPGDQIIQSGDTDVKLGSQVKVVSS